MEWLVVQSATKVRFKGKATINGEGLCTFKVTAEDNGEPGTGDWFKIEIWMGPDVDMENSPPVPKHKAQGYLGGGKCPDSPEIRLVIADTYNGGSVGFMFGRPPVREAPIRVGWTPGNGAGVCHLAGRVKIVRKV